MSVVGYTAPGSSLLHRPLDGAQPTTGAITLCNTPITPRWDLTATGRSYNCRACNTRHAQQAETQRPWAHGELRRYTTRRHPELLYFQVDFGPGNTRTGYSFRLMGRPRPGFTLTPQTTQPKGRRWLLTTLDSDFQPTPIGRFITTSDAVDWTIAVHQSDRLTEMLRRITQDPDWTMDTCLSFLFEPPHQR